MDDELINRIRIRELYSQFALAAVRRDVDSWLDCWSRDGVWKTPHFGGIGRDELRSEWNAIWMTLRNVAIWNEVGHITLLQHSARSHCCVREVVTLNNGDIVNMAGLYIDELVKHEGVWRFSSKTYELLSEYKTPFCPSDPFEESITATSRESIS